MKNSRDTIDDLLRLLRIGIPLMVINAFLNQWEIVIIITGLLFTSVAMTPATKDL